MPCTTPEEGIPKVTRKDGPRGRSKSTVINRAKDIGPGSEVFQDCCEVLPRADGGQGRALDGEIRLDECGR